MAGLPDLRQDAVRSRRAATTETMMLRGMVFRKSSFVSYGRPANSGGRTTSGTMPNGSETIYLVASGDLRLSANQNCWPAQERVESAVIAALEREGRKVRRAHPYDPERKHGFIDSQKYGMEVFREIPPEAPLVVVEAVWQYSHHVLHGLYRQRGPVLTVANWSGQWPGLVGMLNLNGSAAKAGIRYSTLWSADFTDEFFLCGLREWLRNGRITH